jgi:hypothetical protein
MSMPVAFAFDFVKVITRQNSGFVAGNFARSGSAPCDSDSEFDDLQFELIYHDSPTSRDVMSEIHNWRMSEVVVYQELPLLNLSYIICRTLHEERTLRHMLGTTIAPRIIVEQRGSIFMRRGMFIDEIYWSDNVMFLKFHGPTGFTKDTYSITVTCDENGYRRQHSYSIAPTTLYRFPGLQASMNAVWRIELEGCLTYHGPIPSTSGLVIA